MATPSITPSFLLQLDASLTGLLWVHSPGDVYRRGKDRFREACIRAGFSPDATMAELIAAVRKGTVTYYLLAVPHLKRFLRIAQLAVDHGGRSLELSGGRAPLDRAAVLRLLELAEFTPKPPPPAPGGSSPDTAGTVVERPPTRTLYKAALGLAFVGVVALGWYVYAASVDDSFLRKNRKILHEVAAHLTPPERALDAAMAARGFVHEGVSDAEWRTYSTPRRLAAYYHAAEAHTPTTGARALALLARDLAVGRRESLSADLSRRIQPDLPTPPTVVFTDAEPRGDSDLPPEAKAAVKLIAETMGGSADGDRLFKAVGFEPRIPRSVWDEFSMHQRVTYLYTSAEAGIPNSGERALALLSRALAQRYESFRREPVVQALFARASPGDAIQFASIPPNPPSPSPPLPKPQQEIVQALAEYVEAGAVGPRAALVNSFRLDVRTAERILSTSPTVADALERGILEVPSGARDAALDRLVVMATSHYEAAKSEPAIRQYVYERDQAENRRHAEWRAAEARRASSYERATSESARTTEYSYRPSYESGVTGFRMGELYRRTYTPPRYYRGR